MSAHLTQRGLFARETCTFQHCKQLNFWEEVPFQFSKSFTQPPYISRRFLCIIVTYPMESIAFTPITLSRGNLSRVPMKFRIFRQQWVDGRSAHDSTCHELVVKSSQKMVPAWNYMLVAAALHGYDTGCHMR